MQCSLKNGKARSDPGQVAQVIGRAALPDRWCVIDNRLAAIADLRACLQLFLREARKLARTQDRMDYRPAVGAKVCQLGRIETIYRPAPAVGPGAGLLPRKSRMRSDLPSTPGSNLAHAMNQSSRSFPNARGRSRLPHAIARRFNYSSRGQMFGTSPERFHDPLGRRTLPVLHLISSSLTNSSLGPLRNQRRSGA